VETFAAIVLLVWAFKHTVERAPDAIMRAVRGQERERSESKVAAAASRATRTPSKPGGTYAKTRKAAVATGRTTREVLSGIRDGLAEAFDEGGARAPEWARRRAPETLARKRPRWATASVVRPAPPPPATEEKEQTPEAPEPVADGPVSTVVHDDHTYCVVPCGPGCPADQPGFGWSCSHCGAWGRDYTREEDARAFADQHVCRSPEEETPAKQAPAGEDTPPPAVANGDLPDPPAYPVFRPDQRRRQAFQATRAVDGDADAAGGNDDPARGDQRPTGDTQPPTTPKEDSDSSDHKEDSGGGRLATVHPIRPDLSLITGGNPMAEVTSLDGGVRYFTQTEKTSQENVANLELVATTLAPDLNNDPATTALISQMQDLYGQIAALAGQIVRGLEAHRPLQEAVGATPQASNRTDFYRPE
jgi:hypothetical protein